MLVHYLLLLVPSAPRNLTQIVDNSTASSIFLQWEAPLPPNGVIISYEITYRGVQTPNAVNFGDFTSPSMLRIGPVTSFNLIEGLMPGSVYEVSVQAATSVGFGPSSNTTVAVTAESGEPTSCEMHTHIQL